MDCVSVIITSILTCFQGVADSALGFLRNLGAEGIGNLFNLGKNVDALAKEMRELKEMRDDLEYKVWNLERQQRVRRTRRVSGWLGDVDAVHDQVRGLQDSLERRSTLFESCSVGSLHSGFMIGGGVADAMKCVRELRGKRGDLDGQLVEEAPPDPVVPIPTKSGCIVGGEKTLSEIRSHLQNAKVGIIGIYGMGGVGKTTLLKAVNNQFIEEGGCCDFDVVIWATVSREQNVFKIQEDIGLRLGFSRRGDPGGRTLPENEDDRRNTLYSVLVQKRFLLLLDDMWEALDLEELGIPHPNNILNSEGKKIVFTTRWEVVCADMFVQQAKVKVGFLDWEESWKLFRSNLDVRLNLDNNMEIQKLAEIVVRKCGSLPLALITMGRAMSNATRVGEWRQAVDKLSHFPNKIRGMEDVLYILKFSFDHLEDDTTRECLLYCALFPEDCLILISDLVDYWVGECFLDADSSSDWGGLLEARDRGDCMVRKLKDACLLECGDEDEDMFVKMHDVVGEMALWLTGEEFGRTKRFVVCDGERGMARLADATMWLDAKRISVTEDCRLSRLPSLETQCSNLSTVLIRRWNGQQLSKQLVIPQSFWESLPALRVLDLSSTDLTELPGAIGSLLELRHLDLSRTRIRLLPKELGKLVKLRQLTLRITRSLSHVPLEAILTLTRLQKLDLSGSAYRWGDDGGDDPGGAKLSDVGSHLGRLEEVSVTIHTVSCLQMLAQSEKLRKCAREVELWDLANCTSPCLSAALNKLERLRVLRIHNCGGRLELKFVGPQQWEDQVGRALHPPVFPYSLEALFLENCHGVKNLRWVGQLPQLEGLYVFDCEALEELLVDDGLGGEEVADHSHVKDIDSCSFPKLKLMSLGDLPALKSISRRPLLFPSLLRLFVNSCPMLKRLPVGPHSCPKIRRIRAEQGRWDALEWDDYDADSQSSSIRSALAHRFLALKG